MKRTLSLGLFSILFLVSVSAQTKPAKKPVAKPTPQVAQKITSEKAITEKGKPVVLKSNGTWEFMPVEVPEKPTIKPCDIILKNAPVLRGFKLSMPLDQAKAIFAEQGLENPFDSRPQLKPNYITSYFLSQISKFENFQDVRSVTTDFLGDRLYSVQITYDIGSVNFSIADFKSKLKDSFNLPVEAWSDKTLQCRGFSVEISEPREILGNSIKITDLTMDSMIKRIGEEQRKDFKP